jgi:general secretion pathway protein E
VVSEHCLDQPLDLCELVHALRVQGLISRDDAEGALGSAVTAGELHPLVYLDELGLDDQRRPAQRLDLETLTLWLALEAGQAYWRIDPLHIDVDRLTGLLPWPYAQRHGILAVGEEQGAVIVASAQPYISSWLPTLAQALQRPIKRVVANPLDIQRFGAQFYRLAASVNGASNDPPDSFGTSPQALLTLGEAPGPLDMAPEPVVGIVDWLLQHAFQQRASDIHIEPRQEQGRVRFRIDGLLHNVHEFAPTVLLAMISRLKSLGRMNVAEKRRPQDGRVKTRLPEGGEVELRLSTLPTAFGEKMVLRIFDPQVLLRDFNSLGFSNRDLQRWQEMLAQPNGIILVTGPTGSGKTTTLYTTLKKLATEQVNLCTVEDPIEMLEPSFNQMQVQHNIDLTFANGLRALMRQDPDVIMVGEIRDIETAEMAIQAALTGHLVLSTLHTNDATAAVGRLLELGVPHYLIKATLLGVMAQRLVRTLCTRCKVPGALDASDWQALTDPWRIRQPESIQRPVGCLECRDTGFAGRAALYEILVMSEALKDLITASTDQADFRRQALKEGMRSLRLSGAQKVAAGLTTVEEVLRTTPRHEYNRA